MLFSLCMRQEWCSADRNLEKSELNEVVVFLHRTKKSSFSLLRTVWHSTGYDQDTILLAFCSSLFRSFLYSSFEFTTGNVHILCSKNEKGKKDEYLITVLFFHLTNLLDVALNPVLWDSEVKWSPRNLMRLMFKPPYYLKPSKFIFSGTMGLL